MLTREENEMITRVGREHRRANCCAGIGFRSASRASSPRRAPRKSCGSSARRLVLFRDKKGNVGLFNDRCSHRGASLCYGRVEERGIACPYHGWLYDTKGNCLESRLNPPKANFT